MYSSVPFLKGFYNFHFIHLFSSIFFHSVCFCLSPVSFISKGFSVFFILFFLFLFSFDLFFRLVKIHRLHLITFQLLFCLNSSFLSCSSSLLSFSFFISLPTSVQCHQPLFISFTTNSLTTLTPPSVPWDSSSLEPESTQSACCVVTLFLCICPLGVSGVSGDEGFVVQRA